MNHTFTYHRNRIVHVLYKHILKPIFFRCDPELIHERMTGVGAWLGRYSFSRSLTRGMFSYENPILEQKVLGLDFKNPIGLAAGFDKNAQLIDILPSVGFGFAEVGSITGEKCEGNPKPRLWRLPKSQSLVVYYGLMNDGCDAISQRLQVKLNGGKFSIPIGASVAMTNCKENLDVDNAVRDFAKAFRIMEPIGSYITVNISCPNAQGGQPFVAPDKLNYLFDVLDKIPTKKPVFIKLSPDLSHDELDAILAVSRSHRIQGIICTNLTKKRDNPKISDAGVPVKGGLSGKVVQSLADEMLGYIYKKEAGRFILIGCGGVFTAEDAYRKIRLGATLVELITGMIYEGPQVVSEINRGLVELLRKDGFTNISQAIGADFC
ncbi:MAG: quinone-dependent dihydroorotate dehydrogenase [Candidatus Taylorbacteria bacterium]|nr:quinone-dependent dihydroorotate dehydrogenase [Candidatus Taylorbacteria bacterium]